VRPLSSETWREDQLIALINGGNKRLNDFLAISEVFLTSAEKYSSKAATHYRKHSHEAKIPGMPSDFEVFDESEEVKSVPNDELIKLMSPPTKTDRFLYFCKDTKERFDKLELGKKTKDIWEGTSKAMTEEYHKIKESQSVIETKKTISQKYQELKNSIFHENNKTEFASSDPKTVTGVLEPKLFEEEENLAVSMTLSSAPVLKDEEQII
jgi:hypothetical protein